MKPYGERRPRVNWRENHGCPCCDSYKALRKKDRKPSKARERQAAVAAIDEFDDDVRAWDNTLMDGLEDE